MIETLRKIWQFAGAERKNINKSVFLSFINAILRMCEIGAIYVVVTALVNGRTDNAPAWLALGLIVISILGTAITKYFSQLQQTHAGYFMAANKRINIANRLKSVPMGYFNENSLGEVTGVCTTVLDNVETVAPMVLVNILGGLINSLVFTLMILCWDWRIGIIVILGTALYLQVTSLMERKSRSLAPNRQKSEAILVSAVLEYIQGMSVIKAFNLNGKGDKNVQDALEFNKNSNLALEHLFTPYTMLQGIILQAFSICMVIVAVHLWLSGTLNTVDALMTVIISFLVFAQIQSAGSGLALLRVVSSSIEHAEKMDSMPQLDEKGREISPKHHEITFDNVSFSYDKREILHNISLSIPDKTTTAIVGPSGSGKTTLCNLIARFWDVDKGNIIVGGHDVTEYTLESLMNQISMVFQNVYLFADTIENNIKFGKPNATHSEVVAVAKKACCEEFIEALPQGYNTVIGEGGASLSGGERQRLSIARAMLKDAPIVILDEATANVDPENEDRLQKAIEELTRNKTIIMIAHRLKTVRNADQILVVENGALVQRGTHEQLLGQKGIYADFVLGRKKAIGWKL
ncbi:MAG: ABC transporter ATP-binding protein [Aminipila sp.]